MAGWTWRVGMIERAQEQPEQLELEPRELVLRPWVERLVGESRKE